MDQNDLVALALSVVTRDLGFSRRMIQHAKDWVIEEGDLQVKLRIDSSELRQLLYRLQMENLVVQLGTKEDEEGNRFTYWRINHDLAASFLMRKMEETRKRLLEEIEKVNRTEYYTCAMDPSHAKVSFDELVGRMGGEGNMECPKCGAMLVPLDKDELVSELTQMIELIDEARSVLQGVAGS